MVLVLDVLVAAQMQTEKSMLALAASGEQGIKEWKRTLIFSLVLVNK